MGDREECHSGLHACKRGSLWDDVEMNSSESFTGSLSGQTSMDATELTDTQELDMDLQQIPTVTMTLGGSSSTIGGSTTHLENLPINGCPLQMTRLNAETVENAFELGSDGLPDFGPDVPIHPGASTPLLQSKLLPNSSSLSLPLGSFTYREKANLSETNSLMMPICRICHMPEEESSDLLISPCRCSGSLAFIHNRCLMRWLEITSRKSRKPPKCELCHYQYHRHKKFKFQHWRLPRVSRQDKVLHVIFIVNLLIMIGCAIATVMCFLSDNGQVYQNFPKNKVDLTTEEIITLSCGVLFFVSFFIAMSVQIKAKHTIYQLFVKFIMQNMEWEIDEYDKSKDSLFKPPNIHV